METVLGALGNCMFAGIVCPSPETQPHQGQKDLPPAQAPVFTFLLPSSQASCCFNWPLKGKQISLTGPNESLEIWVPTFSTPQSLVPDKQKTFQAPRGQGLLGRQPQK